MADAVTIITSLAGGSLAGGLLGAWQSARLQGTTRRGRARLVHEDLFRLQSTVTRLFYETAKEEEWGGSAWLLTVLAGKDDEQDVVAHLRARNDFTDCAGALGWSQYLREAYGKGAAPNDEALKTMYRRLDRGRRAVSRLAKLPYEAHHPDHVVAPAARRRNQQDQLAA